MKLDLVFNALFPNDDTKFVESLNDFFKAFQKLCFDFEKHIGEGTSSIDSKGVSCLTKEIPQLFNSRLGTNLFKVKGSVGTGRISKCPWLAIMNRQVTEDIQRGVYLVFLFSSDLQRIYLSFNQGVTDAEGNLDQIRDLIRSKIKISSPYFDKSNSAEISNEKYRQSAIFDCQWNLDDPMVAKQQLEDYLKVYDIYTQSFPQGVTVPSTQAVSAESGSETTNKTASKHFSVKRLIYHISETGLMYAPQLIKRFAFSLLAKRFLILSGLAGSGKTQLAIAFAQALVEDESKQMKVVAVGADWTNREPLLGFPNALQKDKYEKPESGVLDLLIEANKDENKNKPYFLILDEMNMSYVERYFADFLSAMESGRKIPLWAGSEDVPATIGLPDNLFIVGTINVDETTYMFSPKVLDRANVIEFKVSTDEMKKFLAEKKTINRDGIRGSAKLMSEDFVKLATEKTLAESPLADEMLAKFFDILKKVNAEFGYRTATEIYRFINMAQQHDDHQPKMSPEEIVDSAIVQKLLPKLHGSRKKLSEVLKTLWMECYTDPIDRATNVFTAAEGKVPKLPLTADKILRMHVAAEANGFASFAEA